MKKLVILCLVLGLAGCELGDRDNKRALGTLVGLGLGAALGYSISGSSFHDQLLTTTLAAAGGAAAGYYLAERLLPHDREKLDSTAFNALNEAESGASVAWGEKRKGAWGSFTLVRDYVSKEGLPCREYVATINYDGESGEIREAACRLDNGSWRTVTA